MRLNILHKPHIVFAVIGLVIALLFSCSRTEPKISYGFIQLVYYQGQAKPEERFSFFIIPDDEEGIENLDELYLYNDWEQLRWVIKSDDWVSYEQDGTTWIGSRSIALADGESLPRGQYRAVLVNKGGEKSERNFTFDAPEESRFPFPALEISGGLYTVSSSWPENSLVFYDVEGKYLSTVRLTGLFGVVADLPPPPNARSAALWAEDNLYLSSAFTDVVSLR